MFMIQPYTDNDILSCNRIEHDKKIMTRIRQYKAASHHHADFCTILSRNYHLRHTLQKAEFAICWILLLMTLLTNTVFPLSVLYMKVSAFTRVLAYAFDLANAWVKRNRKLPMWLILHHSGCTGQHFTSAFFITPNSPLHVTVFLLGSQSTHNTWTKRLSLVLYWGNVLVGVLASIYSHCYLHVSDIAGACFIRSFVMTSVGVALLVSKSIMEKRKMVGKKKWRFSDGEEKIV